MTGRVVDAGALAGDRRARPARRRPGPRRGAGRRARARLRLLRRLRPEVALRPGRHRLPLRRARSWHGDLPAPLARLPAPRATRARRSTCGCSPTRGGSTAGFPAPHHVEWALASLDVLEEAGWAERARPRRSRWPHAGRAARASAAWRWRRAATRRSSPGEVPDPEARRRSRPPRRASWCATSRARPSCAPRSAPGPPRRSSSAWLALAADAARLLRRSGSGCRTRSRPARPRHPRRPRSRSPRPPPARPVAAALDRAGRRRGSRTPKAAGTVTPASSDDPDHLEQRVPVDDRRDHASVPRWPAPRRVPPCCASAARTERARHDRSAADTTSGPAAPGPEQPRDAVGEPADHRRPPAA